MPHSSPRQDAWRPLAWLIDWWRARSEVADLECCGSAEVERIAGDLGMSAAELRTLASHGPNAAELLNRRMAALRIDPDRVGSLDPFMLRDLQRLCTTCTNRKRCARDLADAAGDLAENRQDWQDYCPNAATLNMLVALESYRPETSPYS
jgi:hypothetical protein